jgi:hypothetical protein
MSTWIARSGFRPWSYVTPGTRADTVIRTTQRKSTDHPGERRSLKRGHARHRGAYPGAEHSRRATIQRRRSPNKRSIRAIVAPDPTVNSELHSPKRSRDQQCPHVKTTECAALQLSDWFRRCMPLELTAGLPHFSAGSKRYRLFAPRPRERTLSCPWVGCPHALGYSHACPCRVVLCAIHKYHSTSRSRRTRP